jgi:hypothetical protein
VFHVFYDSNFANNLQIDLDFPDNFFFTAWFPLRIIPYSQDSEPRMIRMKRWINEANKLQNSNHDSHGKRGVSVVRSLVAGIGTVVLLNAILLTGVRDASAALPGNEKSPEAVNRVISGKLKTANAAWWGFDAADATESIQSAINSGAKKVIIPNMGRDWIVRPIQLAGDQEVFFEKGTAVTAKKGEFRGGNDSLFRAVGKSNIVLRGYGALLRMQKQDYMNPPYSKAEWRMVLDFDSCTGIRILGLTIKDSGGDGIYLGVDKSGQLYNKNVLIRDVICDNNYRQGISVISAEDLTIENCTFRNTGGTAPEAGIDLEPNFPDERLTRCVIRNSTFVDNRGAGIQFWLGQFSSKTADISVTIENCRVTSDKGGGIFVGGIRGDGPGGLIDFRKCTVENTAQYGLLLYAKSADRALARFTDCTWKNTAAGEGSDSVSPFIVSLCKRGETDRQGGAEWINCSLDDSRNRPFLTATSDTTGYGVYSLKGTLKVSGPGGGRMDLGDKSGEIDVMVK